MDHVALSTDVFDVFVLFSFFEMQVIVMVVDNTIPSILIRQTIAACLGGGGGEHRQYFTPTPIGYMLHLPSLI